MPPSNSGPMPDEMEAKRKPSPEALRLLGKLSVNMLRLACDSMAYGKADENAAADEMTGLIDEALRSARAEAFEEAAVILDAMAAGEFDVQQRAILRASARLRNQKAKP